MTRWCIGQKKIMSLIERLYRQRFVSESRSIHGLGSSWTILVMNLALRNHRFQPDSRRVMSDGFREFPFSYKRACTYSSLELFKQRHLQQLTIALPPSPLYQLLSVSFVKGCCSFFMYFFVKLIYIPVASSSCSSQLKTRALLPSSSYSKVPCAMKKKKLLLLHLLEFWASDPPSLWCFITSSKCAITNEHCSS